MGKIDVIPARWWLLALNPNLVRSFKEKVCFPVDPCGNECWTWEGGFAGNYGEIRVRYWPHEAPKPRRAHRIAAALQGGWLSPRFGQVRHQCHNTACVYPRHFLFGSATENVADRKLVASVVRITGKAPPVIGGWPYRLWDGWGFPDCDRHHEHRIRELLEFCEASRTAESEEGGL